jgi:hypothetical protein
MKPEVRIVLIALMLTAIFLAVNPSRNSGKLVCCVSHRTDQKAGDFAPRRW